MKKEIKERVLLVASYIKATHSTIRDSAELFGTSKSTTHLDVSRRLKKIDPALYKEVKKVLKENFDEKHIRGGQSTKKKYQKKQ